MAASDWIDDMVLHAVNRERERCIKIVETEEEADGEPPQEVIDAMETAGPVMNVRAAIRATKKSIVARIIAE